MFEVYQVNETFQAISLIHPCFDQWFIEPIQNEEIDADLKWFVPGEPNV